MSKHHSHRSGKIGSVTHSRLIRRFAQADLPPADMARELGLTPTELARWGANPENLALLESLVRLADIRAQLLLSNFRANAAVHLIQLATSTQDVESSRKACVDLLKANLCAFAPSENALQESAPDAAGGAALDDQVILRALESMGRNDLERLQNP